ncbi:MAG TPA: ATP-dependent DNA ligase, partial [Actinobacteria bacterium]|nr:ATP-dependent DNA ligase [Actinomycetota bacterium]
MTLFATLVDASADVAATSSRKDKSARLAELLRLVESDEVEVAVGFLIGAPRQGRIGVGFETLRGISGGSTADEVLGVLDVDRLLDELGELSGQGSQSRRRDLLESAFALTTGPEREFLTRLLIGEVRQGALDGVMIEAIAKAAKVKAATVRRANMLRGDLRIVGAVAMTEGAEGLERFRLEVGRPLEPMLAKTSESVAAALEGQNGQMAVEWKLDGARVQVHRRGDEVSIFTRNLRDVTAGLPEVVEAVRGLPVDSVLLDGEVIALDEAGRPLPFQDTMSRFGSGRERQHPTPLTAFFFDILHLDGVDLIDEPGSVRIEALGRALDGRHEVPRLITDDPEAAAAFAAEALATGHEGVMAKGLTSPYQVGRRGAAWSKVKPIHTLDLVVLAAEWGHGRRTGKLSNLHLGALESLTGEFVMLGKTFKGLTDEMLDWQTERFLDLQTRREGHIVHVRPEQVVEVAFDGVQASRKYPAGMALRFARVKGYREDKSAQAADTI